jgi:hypothetical protein
MKRFFLLIVLFAVGGGRESFAIDCVNYTHSADVEYTADEDVTPADYGNRWQLPQKLDLDLNVDAGVGQKSLSRDSNIPLGSVSIDTTTNAMKLRTADGATDLNNECQ